MGFTLTIINRHIGAVLFESTLLDLILNDSNMSRIFYFYFNRVANLNYQGPVVQS